MLRTLTPRGLLALAVVFIIAAMLAVGIGGAHAEEVTIHHATGTFEVRVTPADPEVVGAFLLAHSGDMTPEGFTLSIAVVPKSGELAGIAGDFGLTIVEGVHHYDLAYTRP